MKQRRYAWGALSLMIASGAWAQVPAGVQPGQIERAQQAPREPVAPIDIPGPAPGVQQQAPAGAAGVRFVLREIAIDGATAYPASALQEAYRAETGQEISLERVYAIAAELTARYRNDGYILSQVVVPAQSIKDGKVTLRAVEGYVHQVTVTGNATAMALVTAYAESIKAARPLTSATLERYLLLINDIPGVSARSTIAASSVPGAADLTLAVTQTDRSIAAGIHNRNSKLIGPWRANLDADLNGLGGANRLGFRGVHTVEDRELAMGTVLYDHVLSDSGLKLNASATALSSRPQATVALPDLRTNSDSASLGLSYPLIRSRLQNLSLRGSAGYHDGDTDSVFAARHDRDRLRTYRAGVSYDLVDSLRGINLFEFDVTGGDAGSGAARSRPIADSSFTKYTYYAARLQSLAPKWSLLFALSGQEARNNLLAPEQFSFGGADFGRGYDAADLIGDSGTAAKLELRFSDKGAGALRDYTAYAFYDAGRVRQHSAASGLRNEHAASAGLGVRFSATGGISGFVEAAQPLNHDVVATANRKGRLFAGLNVAF